VVKVALMTWWSPDKQGHERATRQRARTDGMWLLATLAASADLQMRKLPCRTVAAQRPRLTSSVVVSQLRGLGSGTGSYLRGRFG
jgi:hypothetical protein